MGPPDLERPPPSPPTRWDRGRVFAVVVGAPVGALLVGAMVVAFLPISPPWAFAIGAHLVIPLWVSLACVLPLARSGPAERPR